MGHLRIIAKPSQVHPQYFVARIIEQTHFGTNFGMNGKFTASNGISLAWDGGSPDFVGLHTLYVKGADYLDFDSDFDIRMDKWNAVRKAVEEYNNWDGNP